MNDRARLTLQAIDALTWLPLYPEISLEVMKSLHGDDDTYLRQASDYLAERLSGIFHPRNTIFNVERLSMASQIG